MKVIFAGGGTGGHIFPAIAIADELRRLRSDVEIIFVGAKGRIESKVVPQSGYRFESIWISGFERSFSLKNFIFPLKLFISLIQSFILIRRYSPDVVVGTGGYVSGPVVFVASLLGIPTLIQEQNSYPGLTTRLLASMVNEIHISFEVTRKYLKRRDNVFLSGNPVRGDLKHYPKDEARRFFGLDENRKTLLILGGSLGASSINRAVLSMAYEIVMRDVQMIWQTGEFDFGRIRSEVDRLSYMIKVFKFIDRMDYAYSACDLAVCRAGATTVFEIARFGVPAIFVPYPYATADHQYENARVLFEAGASEIIRDSELGVKLKSKILELISDDKKLEEMRTRVKNFSRPGAAIAIAEAIIKYEKK
jgi:UDP-N-acetylglucosamine--N-acetylmuramyl-(pentapeptide) pyrophosphoryl-undecaprenol N-acetylglucosamine transferase